MALARRHLRTEDTNALVAESRRLCDGLADKPNRETCTEAARVARTAVRALPEADV